MRIIIFFLLVGCVVLPDMSHAYGQSSYYSEAAYYAQSTYYSQATYQKTFTQNATVSKNLTVGGHVSKGSGSFVIDHPLDPKNKLLYHSFVESPDVKNLYDGVVTLDANGEATVTLPKYFEALNKDFRYLQKGITSPMPNLFIKQEITNNRFTIAGGTPNGKVSWQVTGIRHDPYIVANPIIVEVTKNDATIVGPGEYLHQSAEPRLPTHRFAQMLRLLFE